MDQMLSYYRTNPNQEILSKDDLIMIGKYAAQNY
jgi:hypothetical protein